MEKGGDGGGGCCCGGYVRIRKFGLHLRRECEICDVTLAEEREMDGRGAP